MAELEMTERDIKTLQAMVQIGEPTSPTNIGELTGDLPINVGKTLKHLAKGGLAEQTDKKANLWKTSEKGEACLEELVPQQSLTGDVTADVTGAVIEEVTGVTGKPKTVVTGKVTGGPKPPETTEAIPSQSDIFRREGELLGVGVKKGEIHLDTIVKWVQRTANLEDLSSVWNALTEMNVANDVKKRWIKLYAQNLPGKQIPEELKEKLESGLESEKVAKTEAGEIAPKPKRFSIVGDDIVGDPEGDLNFKEALQLLAQKKGVPAEQASPLVAIVEAMKMGPEMATQTLTAMIPLLTKEPPKSNDNVLLQFMQTTQQNTQQQMQVLQQVVLSLTEEKHKAEMESLKTLITTGQRAPEADQRLDVLTKQIETLRESLHQEQLTRMTEQSQRTAELLQGEIKRLEEKIGQVSQSQHTESSLGLLSKAVDKLDGQLSGIRTDARPLVETIMKAGGPGPPPRSQEERARLATVGKEAVLKERRARELEEELLSS